MKISRKLLESVVRETLKEFKSLQAPPEIQKIVSDVKNMGSKLNEYTQQLKKMLVGKEMSQDPRSDNPFAEVGNYGKILDVKMIVKQTRREGDELAIYLRCEQKDPEYGTWIPIGYVLEFPNGN